MGVILKPIITEKMTALGEKLNRYGFIVQKKATKDQIRDEIRKLYGVDVIAVNTMNYSGKNRSRYTKTGFISGKKSAFKKAVVTLAEGENIDFYSNI